MNILAAGIMFAATTLLAVLPSAAHADDFYTPEASEIAGRPGSIIRAQKFTTPPGAEAAYRVLYRSTNAGGKPIAVSGVIVVPGGPVPAGGRAIVSWAHATSGVARSCARSMYPNIYTHMYGLQDMLARGYVVAATDYPGLGGPGVHPYLIGADQGHAVLDIARAARALPEAKAGATFATAGYSQGGHASLYAGTLAKSYAPELTLVGIAASAPPTDLGALIRETGDDPVGRVFGAYALASWSKLYGISLDNVVAKPVRLVVNNIGRSCNMTFAEGMRLIFAEQAFEREGFLQGDVTNIEPWKALLAKNSPGPTPAGIPVFLAQGLSDKIVRPAVTQAYADRLCARGTRVTLVPLKGGHPETGALAAKPMVDWLADRFAGRPAPSDCGPGAQMSAIPASAAKKQAKAPGAMQPAAIPRDKRFYVVDAEDFKLRGGG
jgi:alpha-beta hydrolase superfamily lysophospholipase